MGRTEYEVSSVSGVQGRGWSGWRFFTGVEVSEWLVMGVRFGDGLWRFMGSDERDGHLIECKKV